MLYYLTKFHSLITFTSWDIDKYLCVLYLFVNQVVMS